METSDAEAELKPAMDLLHPIVEKFVSISDQYAPTDDGTDSQVGCLDFKLKEDFSGFGAKSFHNMFVALLPPCTQVQ